MMTGPAERTNLRETENLGSKHLSLAMAESNVLVAGGISGFPKQISVSDRRSDSHPEDDGVVQREKCTVLLHPNPQFSLLLYCFHFLSA